MWFGIGLAYLLVATAPQLARQAFLEVMAQERNCSHTAALEAWPKVSVDNEVAFAALGPCVVPEVLNDLVHKYPQAVAAAMQKNLAFGDSNVLSAVSYDEGRSHALFLFGFRLSFSVDFIVMGCEEDIKPLCAMKGPARDFLKKCVARDKCITQLLKDLH